MEALHRGGGGLDAQKENLDANLGGGLLSTKGNKRSFADAFSAGGAVKASVTPNAKRAAFIVHSDVKPGKKGLKESAKKNRRVLGDISNRHVNRHENAGGSEGGAAKKKSVGLGKVDLQVRTPSGKKKTREATPVQATPMANTRADDAEAVEAAYGGLSSPVSDAQHMKSIREDIARELRNDKTPTFFDDIDFPDPLGDWDSKAEREMLETGAAPSAWWAPPSPIRPEDTTIHIAEFDDVPPPDDFADDPLDPFDDHDLLDQALNTDLDAAASN